MSKDIAKEIIIILLLIILVMVILGFILYQYAPFNKKIPEKISYKTSAEVKEALQAAGAVDEDKVILTYEIDQIDLNNYQRIREYKPGKANPFSTYKTEVAESDETGNSNGGSGSGSGSSSGNTSNSSGGSVDTSEPGTVNPGHYSNNKGTK